MLSLSVQATERRWEPRSLSDTSVDPLLEGGAELIAFVDAVHDGDAGQIAAAREGVVAALGEGGALDAAAVIGNFNMMNRLADATGVPVSEERMAATAELRAAAGIEPPSH